MDGNGQYSYNNEQNIQICTFQNNLDRLFRILKHLSTQTHK